MVTIDRSGYGRMPAGAWLRRAPAQAAMGLAVALGCVLAVAGARQLDRLPWVETITAVRAATWPIAAATVTAARLEEVPVPAAAGMRTELRLAVSYVYDVGSRRFEGGAASLADRAPADDRRLVSLYRRAEFARITGKPLAVSYDPAAPATAYLEAAVPWQGLLPALPKAAGLFFLAGCCFALAFPGRPARRGPSR